MYQLAADTKEERESWVEALNPTSGTPQVNLVA